jgi:hypothetical protein
LGPLFGSTEIRAQLTFSFASSQHWILFVFLSGKENNHKISSKKNGTQRLSKRKLVDIPFTKPNIFFARYQMASCRFYQNQA